MGKKDREKKEENLEEKYKTKEERELEVKNLINQLSDLGITIGIPGMREFLLHSQAFIKEGTYWKGRIKLTGTNRILCGFLTNSRRAVSDITLKYEKED